MKQSHEKRAKKRFPKAVTLALVLLLCAAVGTVVHAQDVAGFSQTGQLEVRGQAIRSVAPDTVEITIGATAQSKNEKDALNEVNIVIESVIASLKSLDVPENQIKTSRLDVSPRYDYLGSVRRISGYTASVSLRVTLMDFELINTVIDTAVSHGANDIGGIRFSFSQENLVYRQALMDAIHIAREKAESMAEAAGVRLGTLLLLRESGYHTYPYANSYMAMDAVASAGEMAATQVMSGEIEISASVDLTYETR